MEHSNEATVTDSKRMPRAASPDTQVPQADGCAESSRLRYAGLARSLDVNGEQRHRPFGGRPARLPVDGVRLIARRRDSRVCAHEPPRPAATPLKVPATVACGGSAEQDRDGNRAKRNPAPIPANPYKHKDFADSGTVRRDRKSRELPFSDETAAAPHADQTNSPTAAHYDDMEPGHRLPTLDRLTARHRNRRAPADAPDRAKPDQAKKPADPCQCWEITGFGEISRDCKFAGFPFSDGPAAAPHTRTANRTTAGSNNNMEPKPNAPPPCWLIARQPDRRALARPVKDPGTGPATGSAARRAS